VADGDLLDGGDLVGDFLGESAELLTDGIRVLAHILLLLLILVQVFVETEMGVVVLAVLVRTAGKCRFDVVVVVDVEPVELVVAQRCLVVTEVRLLETEPLVV